MLTDYLKAIALGIVEGITEWLPISSTGHLILLEELLSLDAPNRLGEEFAAQYSAMFSVVIQLGAILAVAVFYLKALLPTTKDSRALWVKLALATLPAALIGLLADALCERAFGQSLDSLLFCPEVVASALIIYGLLFIVVERLTIRKQGEVCSVTEINLPTALAIGCFQSLALIPGTSRSGATVLGARLLG
ncbi:MAG: undecaprenyl-diphosphatase, partial [Clostridia bacterium]|nr:undecaprenyl-diphosphatase [Clostridia bacterium]